MGGSRDQPASGASSRGGSVGGSRDQPQSVVDHHKVVPWADPEISHSQWWIITRWYRGRIQGSATVSGGSSQGGTVGGSRDQPQSVLDHQKVVPWADPNISHSQWWIITRWYRGRIQISATVSGGSSQGGTVGGSRDQPQSVVDHHKVVPWADPEISHSQWWIITKWYRGRIQRSVTFSGGSSQGGTVGGSRDQPQSVVDHHKVVPWADPEISHSQW